MQKLLLFFSLSFGTIAVDAQPNIVASNTAVPTREVSASVIKTDEQLTLKEAEFDFGKIPQGKPVTHVFEVINSGKDSLRIQTVQASCGCTTPEWERNSVQAPGEKTKITVGYNAASEGPFTKQITITYNGNQTKQILIKGDVWKTPTNSAPENSALESLKN